MQVLHSIAEFRAARADLLSRAGSMLGLVPTMGYLHEGHLALAARALAENAYAAVTIFVNPTQFGANEDFTSYPRDTDRDLALLREAGVHLVFMPTVEEMYPPGFQTTVEVSGVSQGLEGERRPGHFRGVATVVTKLLNIAGADRAYFGQKDAQQVAVIRRMAFDLAMPTQIVVIPTVRAADGLALSSRNSYLTAEQRSAAPVVYRALLAARAQYERGVRDPELLRRSMISTLNAEPLAQTDYVSVADANSLKELYTPSNGAVLFSLAVRFGKTRLIDNLIVGER